MGDGLFRFETGGRVKGTVYVSGSWGDVLLESCSSWRTCLVLSRRFVRDEKVSGILSCSAPLASCT